MRRAGALPAPRLSRRFLFHQTAAGRPLCGKEPRAAYFVVAIVIAIIGMPLHISAIGMPIPIIEFRASQHSFIISICDASIGIIRQTIPSFPISQLIRAIIGPRIIMGIIIGMPIIGIGMPIPPIIGMGIPIPPIIGIIPFIIGMGIGIPMPIPIIPGMPMPPIIPGIPIPAPAWPDIGIPCMPIGIGLIGIAVMSLLLECTPSTRDYTGPLAASAQRGEFTLLHRLGRSSSRSGCAVGPAEVRPLSQRRSA
jgi:hypothetical protein